MADWSKYETRWARIAPRARRIMEEAGAELEEYGYPNSVFEVDDDTAGLWLSLDDGAAGARLELWDSGDADDGIYGEHGNVVLFIDAGDGTQLGGCIPHNYSDSCWLDYDAADEEWEGRLSYMDDADEIAFLIAEHMATMDNDKGE